MRKILAVLVAGAGIAVSIGLIGAGFSSIKDQTQTAPNAAVAAQGESSSWPVSEQVSSLKVAGFFKVRIISGNEPGVILRGSPELRAKTRVTSVENRLVVEMIDWSPLDIPKGELEAVITLVRLEKLELSGGIHAALDGFEADKAVIKIEGAADVDSDTLSIKNLDLELEGAASVDFARSTFTNASVIIEGAGKVRLGMNGGALTGRIDGAGEILYRGTISSQNVQSSFIGAVRQE